MLQFDIEHVFSLSNALSHGYTIDSAKCSQVFHMNIQAGAWGVIEKHEKTNTKNKWTHVKTLLPPEIDLQSFWKKYNLTKALQDVDVCFSCSTLYLSECTYVELYFRCFCEKVVLNSL